MELNRFGYRTTLDSLAGGDVTKYEEILNMPYSHFYTKLVMDKATAEYQERLRELQKD